MYAIGYTSLLTGKYIVGHSRYSDEYTAAEHAAFLCKHYAQRGFKIKHDVVRVDDAEKEPEKPMTK